MSKNFGRSAAKYFAILKISAKDMLSFRTDFVLTFVMRILYPLVMVFVWAVVFKTTNVAKIGTYNFTGMIAYFFIASVIELAVFTDLPYSMQHDIKHGSITQKISMPIAYIRYILSSSMINNFIWSSIIGIPLLVLITFVFGLHVSAAHFMMFVFTLAIGVSIAYSLEFIIGCISVYTNDINGILTFEGIMASLFGGALIPITLFPGAIGKAIGLLPFQFMFYLPITAFTGSAAIGPKVLLIGLVWLVAFIIIGYFIWKNAFKKITSAGG